MLKSPSLPQKRVLIIITGGTICMRPSEEEGVEMRALSCSSMQSLFESMPVFNQPYLPAYTLLEWEDLLDSSDVTCDHWESMAEQIRERYNQYDGFIILHGTDTLAFTASALSFMFEANLNKTIVVTGAMLPISHINTDAIRNITVSMLVAAYSQINEVLVVFGTRILQGNRVVKTNCTIMDAFDTPNYPHVGQVGIDITMNSRKSAKHLIDTLELKSLNAPVQVFTKLKTDHVCVLQVTPSFDPTILRQLAVAEREPFGVILQLYGTGTAPSNARFQKAVEFAIASGVTIVAVTQCMSGSCSLRTYANGVRLHELGVIEGKDLTAEAAFVKLAYLFGKGYKGEELRRYMETSLKGEMCERLHKITGQATMHPIEQTTTALVEDNKHFKLSVRSESDTQGTEMSTP